jgi:hypothetical protein
MRLYVIQRVEINKFVRCTINHGFNIKEACYGDIFDAMLITTSSDAYLIVTQLNEIYRDTTHKIVIFEEK